MTTESVHKTKGNVTHSDKPDETGSELHEQLSEGWELGIAWAPRHRLISILVIRVNRSKIAVNVTDDESPFVIMRLPPPQEGKYEIAWAISPEVPIHQLAIAVRNRTTGQLTLVKRETDLKTGKLWQHAGVIINAP